MHRGMFFALLLILPALFVSGLLLRHAPLAARTQTEFTGNKTVSQHMVLLGGQTFHVRISDDQSGTTGRVLELTPESTLLAPDVLVYWSKREIISDFPAGAEFLGAFEPTKLYRLPMRETQGNGQGFIVLYSLAHRQTVGSFAISSVGTQP